MTNDPDTTVLACPAKDIGHVAVHCYGKRNIEVQFTDTKKTIVVQAHQSQIGCMELDYSGKKLATASEKVVEKWYSNV